MERVLDISEVLGEVDTPRGRVELCASAIASYDELKTCLEVWLDSFLRTKDYQAKEKQFHAGWLPKPETMVEPVGPDEAIEMSRDIFHSWVRKVRRSVPGLHAQAVQP
jgi:hypothetical protein